MMRQCKAKYNEEISEQSKMGRDETVWPSKIIMLFI